MSAQTKPSLSPLSRLKRRSDFLAVSSKGQKWVSKTLILQALPIGGQTSRFGLTVTKKVSPKAVDRNRIRRRLRAIALEILGSSAKSGIDYVLIGRIEALAAETPDLKKDLTWCLKRLNMLETP